MYVWEFTRKTYTGMFVKWFKHKSSKQIFRIIRTYFSPKYFVT